MSLVQITTCSNAVTSSRVFMIVLAVSDDHGSCLPCSVMVWKEARGVSTQRNAETAIMAGIEGLRGGTKQRWTASVTLMKTLQVFPA